MPGTKLSATIASIAAIARVRSAGRMKRRSISALAFGATVLTVCPPLIVPTLQLMPFGRSVSACSRMIFCAISSMALMPSAWLLPECAALPVTSRRMNTPPLRPVTTPPPGRPGSLLKTARAARASVMISSFDDGEPISSSAVKSAVTGAGAAANLLSAAMTKALMASPAFMSAQPGPDALPSAMRNGRRMASPCPNTVSRWPISRIGALPRARAVADTRANGVAEAFIGEHFEADVVAREKAAQLRADGVDAGLVIGAAVDVHQRSHETDHGLALAGEPVEHRGFFFGKRRHSASIYL